MNKNIYISLLILFTTSQLYSQNRISDNNKIAWCGILSTMKFSEKWSWHAEFQYRRVNWITNPQQNLFRTGINYLPNKKISFRLGYARVETYPYGEYPLNSYGKRYSEDRFFEMVTFNEKINHSDLSHRFVLEQRFVGKYSSAALTSEDGHNYVNRIRYMFRFQMPLQKIPSAKNAPYLAAYDEVFIGFGKNVGENIFDQNRLGLLFGYKLSDLLKLEGGYLSQIVQLGREVNNKNVFQYNGGVVLNVLLGFDVGKKSVRETK